MDDNFDHCVDDSTYEMSQPGTIYMELGLENQSDCAISSITVSKPRGLSVQLRPLTDHWEPSDDPNTLIRLPSFDGWEPTSGPAVRAGVCSTCLASCPNCKLRRERNNPSPKVKITHSKRFVSCAYIDIPTRETYRIGVELPTADADVDGCLFNEDGWAFGIKDDRRTSHAGTQTDDVSMSMGHNARCVKSQDTWLSNDAAGEDATIAQIDQEETMVDSDQFHMEDEYLFHESVLPTDILPETGPSLFDMTPGEQDHLMRMDAVFGGLPLVAPLQESMLHENEPVPNDSSNVEVSTKMATESHQTMGSKLIPRHISSLGDSLELTADEFEQFSALNVAFGSPSVIPIPRSLSAEGKPPTNRQVEQQSLQKADSKAEIKESQPAVINLNDSLDLTPEEYEQFVAMNAAFGGPSVIPPPRLASVNSQESKVPLTRPGSLDLQPVLVHDTDRMPSPRSPGLSRQSAVTYLDHTETSSSIDDNSRQSSLDKGNSSDTLDPCESRDDSDLDSDVSSLVESSQDDEGSLTPIFEDQSLTLDLGANENSHRRSETPSLNNKLISKGPEFVEELTLSEAAPETHGDNAVLMRCRIDACPPARISWFYKDEPLGDSVDAVDPDRIELTADESLGVYSLLLRDVEGFDTGVYTCKASNLLGEATSAAELIVQELVSDSEYDTARSYFTSGDEIVDIPSDTWLARRKGGPNAPMLSERTVRITTHGATPPQFTFQPQSRVVEIGQTAKLVCGVKGSPKPRVSWFNHGIELKSEGRYRVFESEQPGNFVLEIREVEVSDAGHYTCTAGNIIGQVYCSAHLSVEEFGEPEIDATLIANEMSSLPVQYLQYGPDVPTKGERDEEALPPEKKQETIVLQKLFTIEGSATKLQCSVAGYKASDITWSKHGARLTTNDRYIISVKDDNSILTIAKTKLSDEGEYSCHLTDLPHTELCRCVLAVHEAESSLNDQSAPPTSTVVASTTNSSVTVAETCKPDCKQPKIAHTDSLEVVNPAWFSPVLESPKDNQGIGKRNKSGVCGSNSASSSNGSGEATKVKWREKPPYASPRKHKEARKNRKPSRGIRHYAEASYRPGYSKYDLSESDSSSDSVGRPRKEKTPSRKSKTAKKTKAADSSESDREFDTGLERILALSDKADACLHIVNSVLEMTTLDKEVDDALQEQISALLPDVSEPEGGRLVSDDMIEGTVDSDADADFITQLAAQRVAGALAEQMMREASDLEMNQENDNLPLENGLPNDNKETNESHDSNFEESKTRYEVLQELPENVVEDVFLVVEDVFPVVEDALPVVEDAFPVVEDALPVVEDAFPVVEDALPVVEDVLPVVEDVLPVVEDVLPVVEDAFPVVEDALPVVEDVLPVVEDVLPVVEDVLPVVEDAFPVVEDAFPVVEDVLPVVEDVLPVVEDALPVVEDALPVVEDALPVVEDAFPVVEDVLPVVEDVLPVVEDVFPVVEDVLPVVEDVFPVKSATPTEKQELDKEVENRLNKANLKLSLNMDAPVERAQTASPRACLFRGPEDRIFTLDEIIDDLPESAVDEQAFQKLDSNSPDEETKKFTLLECSSQPSKPDSSEESTPTASPITECPLQDSSPDLLTRLQDMFVLEGDAMRLEVQIKGFPLPTVTWYRDDQELFQDKNLQLKFDGEDTWALIIRNITTTEEGVYTCTATNTLGSASTCGIVTLADIADGSNGTDADSEEQTDMAKSPLSPAISVTSPSGFSDDVFIPKSNSQDTLPKILLNALETGTDDVNRRWSGEPDCRTLSEILRLDRNANWADESSPDVSRSNSTNSDRGATFRLQKRNRPDSNIEMIRHRKAFRKHPSRDSITSTEPYSTGNSTSESDTEGAPKFTKLLETTEILEGESVQFKVCVTGDPEPQVRWIHDGSELKNNTSRIKCSRVEENSTSSTWQLAISNVRTEDDGRYVCKAENSVGVKSCSAFLIVEALNATEGAATDEDDKKIVSKLLKEKEDEQSIGESSQIEEDLLKTFTVESDYSDSSGRMSVQRGDQVELLDGTNKDRWLVRHKGNSNMIGYIPCTVLKRNPSSSSEKEDKKTIYTFVAKQSGERRSSASMKQRPHTIKHLSLKDGQLSELEEGKMIEDFSDAEPPQSYDLCMAVASYTPSAEQKGFISMTENQVFEVLDSNSALNWLVRSSVKPCPVGWVPASYLTQYNSSSTGDARRISRCLWTDPEEDVEYDEGDEREVREKGNKEKEALLKRGYVLKELLDTERDFVKDLKYVTTRFIPPIRHPNVPIYLKGRKDEIFCNIQEIYDFHNTKFLHELKECENDANSIGRAFIKWQSTFIDLHVVYCKNKPKADTVLTPAAKAFFLQYGGGTGPGQLGLGDYLIKPVQRITKYQLLLKEIIKYTSRAKEDCQELECAMNTMIEVPKRANDLMYLNLIEGFQRDVTELGKLYRQDSFSAWSGKPKGRGKERHMFLFKDILLFTKPKKDVKGDVVGYIYKSHVVVGALTVSEDISDERRFELWQGRSTPLTLLAKTKYMKEAWVKSLRDLIAEIPRELRETKFHSERRFDHSPLPRKRRAATMLSPGSSMPSLLTEPGLNGNFSKSTESLMGLMPSPTLSLPRSGRGSIDSMMGSVDLTAFTSLHPAVGTKYEALDDLVADGLETLEIKKGDVVKLLDVSENNLFHVQTIPLDESSPALEGYVTLGLLKKLGRTEEPPVFTERLKSCTASTDDSVSLTCSFTGKPNPTVSWSLPSHLSMDDKRLDIKTAEDTSTLTLSNVAVLDTGEYTCTLENASGSVSCSAKLDVVGTHPSSLTSGDLNIDTTYDTPRARSSSPINTNRSQSSPDEPTLVRSTSLENLKIVDEDFDLFPGEIVRASSVSGRGMLNSKKSSSIGSFRKHFRKAFGSGSTEKDKFLQRSQSGNSFQKSKHQQQRSSLTCIHCKLIREEGENGSAAVCEACGQRSPLATSRETLVEEEEDKMLR